MRYYIPIAILVIMLGLLLLTPEKTPFLGMDKSQIGSLAPMVALLVYFLMGHGIGRGQAKIKTLQMVLIWLALFGVVMLVYTQFS